MNKPKSWFEMADVRKRSHDKSVWIPLKAQWTHAKGLPNHVGFTEEYVGVGSVSVPLTQRDETEKLGWMDIGNSASHKGYLEHDEYVPSHALRIPADRERPFRPKVSADSGDGEHRFR